MIKIAIGPNTGIIEIIAEAMPNPIIIPKNKSIKDKNLPIIGQKYPLAYSLLFKSVFNPFSSSMTKINKEKLNQMEKIIAGIIARKTPPIRISEEIEISQKYEFNFVFAFLKDSLMPICKLQTAKARAN